MKNNKIETLRQILEKQGYRAILPIQRDEFTRINGIISDRYGKKYFMKVVIGKDSYEYGSLYNESKVTSYLSRLTKKINMTHKGFRLYTPSVSKVIRQGEFLCFITRFIDGKKLLNEDARTQTRILTTTLHLVDSLSEETHLPAIRPYLKNYTRKAILNSLPLRFLKAIILSPFEFPGLIKASFKTLRLLSPSTYQYGLIHADINISNIIFQGKSVYLTDWEEAGWGINAYNTITPLCVHWQNPILRKRLFDILENNGQRKIIIPLLAYRTLMLFNQRMKRDNKKRKRDIKILKFLENTKLVKI